MPALLGHSMHKLIRHAAKIPLVLLLGGFLGATMVRLAPGFGVDEEELDIRLSQESVQALRQAHSTDENLGRFQRSLFGSAFGKAIWECRQTHFINRYGNCWQSGCPRL